MEEMWALLHRTRCCGGLVVLRAMAKMMGVVLCWVLENGTGGGEPVVTWMRQHEKRYGIDMARDGHVALR